MSDSWGASLVALPVVITGPGKYIARSGEEVNIKVAGGRVAFDCIGSYASGQTDAWNRSGRLYPGIESQNDIVRPA